MVVRTPYPQNDPVFHEAMEKLRFFSSDPDFRAGYELAEKMRMDEAARVDDARAEGKAEGIELTARNLLKLGVPLDIIADGTKLSLKRILQIQAKL